MTWKPVNNPRYRLAATASVLLLLTATPLLAELGTIHKVELMPGADTAELAVDGWLVPAGQMVSVDLVEPPRFGTWAAEVYTPTADFWLYGADRVVLSVTSKSGTTTATVVLLAGRATDWWRMKEDLEGSGGQLSNTGFDLLGETSQLSVTGQALDGSWSLAIDLGGSGAAVRSEGDGGGDINGVDQMGGAAAVNPDLPDGGTIGVPGQSMSSLDPFTLFELNQIARVQMRYRDTAGGTVAEVRAEVDDTPFGCAPTCVTPWREIPIGQTTEVTFWYGVDTYFYGSSARVKRVHMVVETPNLGSHHDRLAYDAATGEPTPAWTVGPLDGTTTSTGRVRLDGLESWWRELRIESVPEVLADDFDTGAWDARWQAIGAIGLDAPFRSASPDWIVEIDSLAQQTMPAMLVDDSPGSEWTLYAELDAGLGDGDLGGGRVYTIWGTATQDGGVGDPLAVHPVEIDVTTLGGARHVRGRLLDDVGIEHTTAWLPLGPSVSRTDESSIVLRWWAGSAGRGGLRLRVDGADATVLGVSNGSLRVREYGFGFWNPRVEGGGLAVGMTNAGRLTFDDVLVLY